MAAKTRKRWKTEVLYDFVHEVIATAQHAATTDSVARGVAGIVGAEAEPSPHFSIEAMSFIVSTEKSLSFSSL